MCGLGRVCLFPSFLLWFCVHSSDDGEVRLVESRLGAQLGPSYSRPSELISELCAPPFLSRLYVYSIAHVPCSVPAMALSLSLSLSLSLFLSLSPGFVQVCQGFPIVSFSLFFVIASSTLCPRPSHSFILFSP